MDKVTSEDTEALIARVSKIENALQDFDSVGRRGPTTAGRLDRLEIEVADTPSGTSQLILRGRVKRLEEAVGEIHEAHASMEQSLRVFALANLRIKRALADVVTDLATLSGAVI